MRTALWEGGGTWVEAGAGEEVRALNRSRYGEKMVLDQNDLPNQKFHKPMGLGFPICKRRGIFEKDFFQRWVNAKP